MESSTTAGGYGDLSDPLGDRVMKDVPPIARWPLTEQELYHNSSKSLLTYFAFAKGVTHLAGFFLLL